MAQFNETKSLEALHVITSMTENSKYFFEMDYLYDIITMPKLIHNLRTDTSGLDDYERAEQNKQDIFENIVAQMSPKLLDGLKSNFIDVSEFIDYLIHNKKVSPIDLSEKDIVDLMVTSSSSVFLDAWILDEELGLSKESIDRLKRRAEEVASHEKDEIREETGYEVDEYGFDVMSHEEEDEVLMMQFFDKLNYDIAEAMSRDAEEPEEYRGTPNLSRYTQDEVDAINIYGGRSPGGSFLAEQEDAYHLLNVLLYPGIQGEVSKFYVEESRPNSGALEEPDALIDCYRNLISAMVKYSLQMEETVHAKRVDRNLSIDLMKENDSRTVSFFSTSLSGYDSLFAVSKIGVALEDVEIKPGTLCIDFSDILQDTYFHSMEAEVLVAPFARGEIEEIPLETEDFSIRDKNGEPPQRKVRVVFKPEEREKLSEEEKKEEQEAYKVIEDRKIIRNAREFLRALKTGRQTRKPFEEFKETIDPKVIEDYLKYKNAIQTIVKFIIREKTIELTQELEEYERENGPINSYRAATVYGEGEPVITGEDLRALAESQTPDQIFSAVDNSTRVLGEPDQREDDKRGEHDEN